MQRFCEMGLTEPMPRGEGTSPLEEYTHQILARPRCLPRELWQGGAPDPGKGGINGFKAEVARAEDDRAACG
jgi:hypothetical protein